MTTLEFLQFLGMAAVMVLALKAWGQLDEAAWRRQRAREEATGRQAE
jgi:hypothetical protein